MIRRARFGEHSSTQELRAELIERDLDDLSMDDIDEIAATYWEEFKPLAIRYLEARWADAHEVWIEAEGRGLFEDDWERDD